MDTVRLGLSLRALRRRRRLTQLEVALRSGVSQSALSRIERGEADLSPVRTLEHVAAALGARLEIRALWQGEQLDRLLDSQHAGLVDAIVRRLTMHGWIVEPEATYAIGMERGSIDILAWHPSSGHLLVVEVKSVVADVQATLAGIDRKARVAAALARGRGWAPGPASRMLVLPGNRTARRHLAVHEATFGAALPMRTIEMRRWIERPDRQAAGVLFVPSTHDLGARHRVRRAGSGAVLPRGGDL